MRVRPYIQEDYILITSWLSERSQKPWDNNFIPKIGFTVLSESSSPIAIGFLRNCEGDICMIDSMIANPNIDRSIRDNALDLLSTSLIDIAKELEYKGILCLTSLPSIVKRSEKHGFITVPQTVIFREL